MTLYKGKTIVLTLKFFVSATLFVLLYYKFNGFKTLSANEALSWAQRPLLLSFALLLMPLNWGLETVKWRLLLNQLQTYSWLELIKSVLCGLALSNLTPGRSGEFIGRALSTPNADKIKVSELSIIGSWSQQMCTLLFGLLAIALFAMKYLLPPYLMLASIFFALLLICISLLYFGITNLAFYLIHKNAWPILNSYLSLLSSLNLQLLCKTFLLSVIRYLCFSLQFYLIFKIFGIELQTIQYLIAIPLIFLIGSYIPSFALLELGVKTAVSIFILNLMGVNNYDNKILLASSALWIINIALPSVLGLILIWRIKFFQEE